MCAQDFSKCSLYWSLFCNALVLHLYESPKLNSHMWFPSEFSFFLQLIQSFYVFSVYHYILLLDIVFNMTSSYIYIYDIRHIFWFHVMAYKTYKNHIFHYCFGNVHRPAVMTRILVALIPYHNWASLSSWSIYPKNCWVVIFFASGSTDSQSRTLRWFYRVNMKSRWIENNSKVKVSRPSKVEVKGRGGSTW